MYKPSEGDSKEKGERARTDERVVGGGRGLKVVSNVTDFSLNRKKRWRTESLRFADTNNQ